MKSEAWWKKPSKRQRGLDPPGRNLPALLLIRLPFHSRRDPARRLQKQRPVAAVNSGDGPSRFLCVSAVSQEAVLLPIKLKQMGVAHSSNQAFTIFSFPSLTFFVAFLVSITRLACSTIHS